MRIAFIVHYFPPLNSTGARRVLAFAKYLHRFGHHISVVTTQKHAYDGFLTEVLPPHCEVVQVGRLPAPPEPRGSSSPGPSAGRGPIAARVLAARRALMQVTGQLIDSRLPFGLRFRGGGLPPDAMDALSRADVLVSSLPPWPVHLAAWFAAKRFGKPWVADFRDQWAGNHMYPGSPPSLAFERWLERKLLTRASAVTVVSGPMERNYLAVHPSVTTIENGYDAEILDRLRRSGPGVRMSRGEGLAPFTLRFLGSVSRDSIPRNLFTALRGLPASARNRVRVEFFGEWRLVAPVVSQEFPDLASGIAFHRQVPHEEALRLMLEADALLFAENSSFDSLSAQGVLTTKLFEYLAAERPILADIDARTLAGGMIVRSGLGAAVSRDPLVLGAALRALAAGGLAAPPDREYIQGFSRERQARRFEQVLTQAVREHGRRG